MVSLYDDLDNKRKTLDTIENVYLQIQLCQLVTMNLLVRCCCKSSHFRFLCDRVSPLLLTGLTKLC